MFAGIFILSQPLFMSVVQHKHDGNFTAIHGAWAGVLAFTTAVMYLFARLLPTSCEEPSTPTALTPAAR